MCKCMSVSVRYYVLVEPGANPGAAVKILGDVVATFVARAEVEMQKKKKKKKKGIRGGGGEWGRKRRGRSMRWMRARRGGVGIVVGIRGGGGGGCLLCCRTEAGSRRGRGWRIQYYFV